MKTYICFAVVALLGAIATADNVDPSKNNFFISILFILGAAALTYKALTATRQEREQRNK